MTQLELKTIFLLAGIYMSRMLGLFLIFPTFSVLAQDLTNATPTKIGLALGIYSLAQAVLQIPAGWLSDAIGRKKVLYGGLTLFCLGSVLASLTDDLDMLILARLLQGMGAVSAVCLAYVGDTIRDSEQGKAMMIIGLSIGLSFMLALILGAVISSHWGLAGIFRTTAVLAVLALGFAYLLPTPKQTLSTAGVKDFTQTLRNTQLFGVNIQVALLHMTLAATFFLLPRLFAVPATSPEKLYTFVYVIPLIITALIVAPLVRNRDKGISRLPYFWGVLAISLGLFATFPIFSQMTALMVVMTLFFCGFTLVETLLPALLLKFSKDTNRGASSGIFSLYQLLGSFFGGLIGAKCYTHFATNGTILQAFYVLAVPAIAVAIAGIFYQRNTKH